ncbi:Kinesin-like protein KIN-14G [Euphorbia peplus]|nr:Kinesin-like protein KIN-14G [Euphorbia peplus]
MATEQVLPFSVVSVVQDILQQHASRSKDIDSVSRRLDEPSSRRFEAAGWLRRTVGLAWCKDLPAEPSEEEFRTGLRSGMILCNVINRVQPGAVPKVVEGPMDSDGVPDGAALSAFQYFENIRNFLVAAQELGLPAFEARDLEQGGKSSRIVTCVLALKSYNEWKQSGGVGTWKYSSGTAKPAFGGAGRFMRKAADSFMNNASMTSSSFSSSDLSLDDNGNKLNETNVSRSMHLLVRSLISNLKQDEIPNMVESMLSKIVEEFERRLANQQELMKATLKDMEANSLNMPVERAPSDPVKMEEVVSAPIETTESEETKETEETSPQTVPQEHSNEKDNDDDVESKIQLLKQQMLIEQQRKEERSRILLLKQQRVVEQQQIDLQELKHILYTTKTGMQFLQVKHQEDFNNLGKHFHSLAHAASGYQRVLEENRKLYNQVQDLKGNIRVYCRVRPFLPGQQSRFSTVDHIEEGDLTIITPSKYGKEGRKTFSFNKVFGPMATQEEVFADTRPLIRSVLDGFNVCIFAYGQTGSGKTFTMTGPKELTEEGLGVNYRALSDLFLLSDERKEVFSYDISVQMLEIYNEQVRDLLDKVRNSSQNGINVPDASLVPVSSPSDVLNLMDLGHKNRAVSATAMNDRSSRSHSCLTVHVQGKNLTSGAQIRGSMHLVDLAGSERVDKSEVIGDRLKEAQHINKSLSALGDVIASLAQKSSHVPYRNSKLTQLLQDSLGGQAKTLMFVHISPEHEALGETLGTLKFAERVATVELGTAKVNKDNSEVKELKEQIASLKAALGRKEDGSEYAHTSRSNSRSNSRSSTPERGRVKAGGFPQAWHGLDDSIRRQSLDNASSISEAKSSSSSVTRRQSLDLTDLQGNSPPWLSSVAQNGTENDKESGSGDWVDKVMVNRLESIGGDENLLGQWELDNRELPEPFYQGYVRDPSKIYPEQTTISSNNIPKKNQEFEAQNRRFDSMSTDGSDDLDAGTGTSDSSEPDLLWQSNLQRAGSLPTKPKKTNSKLMRRPDQAKSMIPSLIPSPLKKSNGMISPVNNKPVSRLQSPSDLKKKTGRAK